MRKFRQRSASVLTLLFAVGSVLAVQAVQADVYRWTDAQGRVQYSDLPVPGAERVSTATRIPASNDAAAVAEREKLKASQTQVQTQQTQTATQDAVKQDVVGARADQCRSARERYDKAIKARRMYRTNAKGEREYLSDADADAARVTAKTELDQICGG